MNEVTLLENDDFEYGEFRGWVRREAAKPKRWDDYAKEVKPAEPEHWCVFVIGVERAWREIKLPLKRGRTTKSVVAEACSQFSSPNDIRPDRHGQLGRIIDQRKPACSPT